MRMRLQGGRAIALVVALVAVMQCPTFIHTAEWLDLADLKSENTLPLITDLGLNVGLGREGLNATSGSCSFIADFGVLDLPLLGLVRSRAGLRYNPLYPRGALELGFRKELRTDKDQGYQLFMGLQSTGDDERLDVLTEIGAIKLFHNARAFYRFLWGFGGPYQEKSGSNNWNQMGSSLGVTQTNLPPNLKGQLTIGWRTGLLDVGLEGGKVLPPMLARRKAQKKNRGAGHSGPGWQPKPCQRRQCNPRSRIITGLRDNLLDSSPFAAYSLELPKNAEVSWTILPEHEVLEHALHWRSGMDATGGQVVIAAVLEQSLSSPRARLRIGTCYERK
ncbi:unnamed protein product [Cladocopium goreaui]|uniref:Beta-galactosidase n=1 Tax=Cladocopium goreaui TaxID=2562237 RepID=A0A9P1DFS7_9DINO|nr:unnamed protein product [Cladocopium goreaui]